MAVIAPLPALVLALMAPDVSVDLPWLLLGARWGLDPVGRIFLGFTAALWLTTGVYAQGYLARVAGRDRFILFWLLTMSGHLGVIVSRDVVSFLAFYALMSFATYGLVTLDGKPASRRAGRVYIALVVVGEVLLLWAALLGVQYSGSLLLEEIAVGAIGTPAQDALAGLVLVGFGIKLGVIPVHFWLPLAHPAAPTPASAILSGAIIKIGLLGWIRFLPVGVLAMPKWGTTCILVGLASAFLAALVGACQSQPKALLAYSSISQMGLLCTVFGAALMLPQHWPLIGAALLLFCVHHAICKAVLFLGVGIAGSQARARWASPAVMLTLVLAALSLAGWPLTSGFVAKAALKDAASMTREPWTSTLPWLLALTGVTTTWMMVRFVFLVRPARQHLQQPLSPLMVAAWAVLAAAIVALPPLLAARDITPAPWTALEPGDLPGVLWPSLVAIALLTVGLTIPAVRSAVHRITIPAGDVLALAHTLFTWWRQPRGASRSHLALRMLPARAMAALSRARLTHLPGRAERVLADDLAVGLCLGLLIGWLLALMLIGPAPAP